MRICPNPTRGCVDEVSLHAPLPIRDRISAAPPRCSPDTRPARESVYPENNREVLPKLLLGPERTMETNPSTHPRAVQNTWTIRKRYGRRYAKICIPSTVSLPNGRRLTGLRAGYDRHAQKEVIYTKGVGEVRLAGQWRIDAVAWRRSAGRTATSTSRQVS